MSFVIAAKHAQRVQPGAFYSVFGSQMIFCGSDSAEPHYCRVHEQNNEAEIGFLGPVVQSFGYKMTRTKETALRNWIFGLFFCTNLRVFLFNIVINVHKLSLCEILTSLVQELEQLEQLQELQRELVSSRTELDSLKTTMASSQQVGLLSAL